MDIGFSHEPVMLKECLEYMHIEKDGTYVDCTAGGGGHSLEIYRRLGPQGKLISIDQDPEAVHTVKKKLDEAKGRGSFIVLRDNFVNIENIIREHAPQGADGILMDLGVSSHQLDTVERGFSYHNEAPLDMRMDPGNALSAYHVVNTYTKDKLVRVFREYGEERYAGRIADAIIYKRQISPIDSTTELAELVKSRYPAKERFKGTHPARRVFQAIRIEVNQELEVLRESLEKAAFSLKTGGNLLAITFHSLEDRIVKVEFLKLANPCQCPPDFPVCVCGKVGMHRVITKKPILPGSFEIDFNRRSRSAKLRVIQRTKT
ncbi:MAG: 16S rRNA (cytosine(1402)-N(4))-methyltransferase RsmH [Clostridia bacterium]